MYCIIKNKFKNGSFIKKMEAKGQITALGFG